MKIVRAIDQYGFERPMPSACMLIPTDWQSQGGTTWNIKDKCNTIQTSLRTSGPDGRGLEIFPAFSWVWADDPKFLQMTAAQTARSGTRPCAVMPPMKASDFLRRNLNRYVGFEPAPKLLQDPAGTSAPDRAAGGAVQAEASAFSPTSSKGESGTASMARPLKSGSSWPPSLPAPKAQVTTPGLIRWASRLPTIASPT